MNPVELYIREVSEIRATGAAVKETSFYPAISQLFNEIGKHLKPRVRCIINLKNKGAGLPDGGFFTPEQFLKVKDGEVNEGQIPSRGALEVKGTSEDVYHIAESEQISKYLQRYQQVFVTNLRDFLLVGKNEDGKAVPLEAYKLANSESDFWIKANNSKKFAVEHGKRLEEYIKRVMIRPAPLTSPEDVAWILASYAKDALARIESSDIPALANVRTALEEALGIKFTGEKGEHFFRSSLIQTLFYGIFSAWVLWHKQKSNESNTTPFDWRVASWTLHVPMIKGLFEQVATPSMLGPLGLVEVLDWTAEVLNRVDKKVFFSRFEEEHAVQYFYEPFLDAFDPVLRDELGVWYTPPEVVQYMVSRVDTVLKEDLNIEDGLADHRVYVLDPCCGTGAYLVEVLKHVSDTLKGKGGDALLAQELKQAAMNRFFGFEILPAPFVVSHLQLGLLLHNLGVPLSDEKNERVGVYLTNSLTGWEPPKGPKQHLMFPELELERDAAEKVKREVPILVILGNPPYNAFAGVAPSGEEKELVKTYKEGLIKEWGIKKFNLDDLYVRFFKVAEQRIAEESGQGIICYISNHSYVGDPSYVVMRQRFLNHFDAIWIDCLNGDSRETGKLTPDGKPDPSIFSTDKNREGIKVGTAIGLMVRKEQRDESCVVRMQNFWGATKRKDLLESLTAADIESKYKIAFPAKHNRFSFRPSDIGSVYLKWPLLTEFCKEPPISGLQEMRKGGLIDIDRSQLETRMQKYFDSTIDWESFKTQGGGLEKDGGGFVARDCRVKVQAAEQYDDTKIRRYALYPFDSRWCYHSNTPPLWNRPRPALAEQKWEGNNFIITRMMAERPNENVVITCSSILPDYHLLRPNAIAIPIYIKTDNTKKESPQHSLFDDPAGDSVPTIEANLSQKAAEYLSSIGITDISFESKAAELLWAHTLAIGFSKRYMSENSDGIRQDWPRIPLPISKTALVASSDLGKIVAKLTDTEKSIKGVTTGTIREEVKAVGNITRLGGGTLDPNSGDLEVKNGWGHVSKTGIMPGKGKTVERDYTETEKTAIQKGTDALGLTNEEALVLLGEKTVDVYLNEKAYWSNIPLRVWEYTIGGYQVIKKWLSYREYSVLGRDLTPGEVREVRDMARRMAALLLMEPALNANYEKVKEAVYPWENE
jgi:hypothetical protein